jgi:uncharacterized membrane protein
MQYVPTTEQTKSLKSTAQVGYILALIGTFIPFLGLATLIIAYIKRDDAAGSFVHSHFRYQIRTFWFALLWAVLGLVTLMVGVGFVVLIVAGIWVLYRNIKGLLRLLDNRYMYVEPTGAASMGYGFTQGREPTTEDGPF